MPSQFSHKFDVGAANTNAAAVKCTAGHFLGPDSKTVLSYLCLTPDLSHHPVSYKTRMAKARPQHVNTKVYENTLDKIC